MGILKKWFCRLFGDFRARYIPLLMVYFAYGASGFSGIAETFWVKEHLNLSAEALVAIVFWAGIPWTIKMVFGQFADSIRIFGSQRKIYIFIGAGLIAAGQGILIGLAAKSPWLLQFGSPGKLYLFSALVSVIGFVLQDVIADAMSTEVVDRVDPVTGSPRPEEDVKKDLGQIQWLGRIAIMFAGAIVAGAGGWLAEILSYKTMFTIALFVPTVSLLGALFVRLNPVPRSPVNWWILGGGLVFGTFTISVGLFWGVFVAAFFRGVTAIIHVLLLLIFSLLSFFAGHPVVPSWISDVYGAFDWADMLLRSSSQEIVFVVSLAILTYLIYRMGITKSLVFSAIVIFVYRAVPGAGPGVSWWMIDVLGFDKAFMGTLSQIGSILGIVGLFVFRKSITEKPIRFTLIWLTVAGALVSLPTIGLYYGVHNMLGVGARTVALVDTTISAPLGQLSMVPLLVIIAYSCPRGHAGTWFALMASLMNLALSASALGTKHLNKIYEVTREVKDSLGNITTQANYDNVGLLLIITWIIGLVVPLFAIWLFLGGTKNEAVDNEGADIQK